MLIAHLCLALIQPNSEHTFSQQMELWSTLTLNLSEIELFITMRRRNLSVHPRDHKGQESIEFVKYKCMTIGPLGK